MRTVKAIEGGRCRVVIRSNGYIYLTDGAADFDRDAKLVATSPAGCHGLAQALLEAERELRAARQGDSDG